MKYRIASNKKAVAMDNVVPLIMFMFFAAFAFLILFANSKIEAKELDQEVSQQKTSIDATQDLLAYLGKIDENGNSRADLISRHYYDNKYEEMEDDIKIYFNSKFSNIPKWYFEIVDKSDNIVYSLSSGLKTVRGIRYQFASAIIPVRGIPSEHLMIKIYFGVSDLEATSVK